MLFSVPVQSVGLEEAIAAGIRWGLLFTVGCFLGAQSLQEDPVMKARLQRSQAQGIDEADLPPVPRGIMVPPPLPPPETHRKDSRQAHVALKGHHAAKGKLAKTSKHPAKGGRKVHKKVKG